MSTLPTEVRSPLLQKAREALNRIKDVSFKANRPESRQACRAQVELIANMPSWGIMTPIRKSYYEGEGNADPNQVREHVLGIVGSAMGSLAAMDGKDEIGPVWELFGLAKGDPALELMQFKETASALMQTIQDSLDVAEKKLRAKQEELESALRSNKEMEALIETVQTRAAEEVAKMTTQLQEQTRKLQEQEATNEKLRTELQTALSKLKSIPAVTPAPAADTVNAEVSERLKILSAELERFKILSAEQAAKIERYANAMNTCFDEEMKASVIFYAEHQHLVDKPGADPTMVMHVKNALFFIKYTLDGRHAST